MSAVFDLADRDPVAAFAELARTDSDGILERRKMVLSTYLLEKDFTKAAEILKLITDRGDRQSVLIAVVPLVFKRDPTATLAVIREQLSGFDQSYALYHVVNVQVANHAWSEAIETQLSMSDTHMRSQAIAAIGGKIPPANLEIALGWFPRLTTVADEKNARSWIEQSLSEAEDDAGLARLLATTPQEDAVKPPGGYRPWGRENLIRRIAWLRQNRMDVVGIHVLRRSLTDPAELLLVDGVVLSMDETLPPAVRVAALVDRHDVAVGRRRRHRQAHAEQGRPVDDLNDRRSSSVPSTLNGSQPTRRAASRLSSAVPGSATGEKLGV